MICWLIRHGRDDDTRRGGWSAASLTAAGREEVIRLAENLSFSFSRIYSSDLPRARETAALLAASRDLPVELRPEFRETNNGDLAGMPNDLALQRYPGLFFSSLGWEERYPNGESPREFFERVARAWERFRREQAGLCGDCVLVTHGGVIEVILHLERELPYSNRHRTFAVRYVDPVPVEL